MKNLIPKAEVSTLSDTEFLAENVKVHGKSCIGCQRWDRDIMVSFTDENKKHKSGVAECFDLFLTTEQATKLRDKLTKELEKNAKGE